MDLRTAANTTFSLLTIFSQAVTVVLILSLLFFRKRAKKLLSFFAKNAILFAFLVATVSTLGSLFYSEILKYEPCKLCWFQRIAMYPMSVLFGIALLKRDKKVVDYGLIFSGIGAVIALYHYLLQVGVVKSGDCAAVGYSVSCAQRFVLEFGYITIPMMAFAGFLLIFTLSLVAKLTKNN